MLSCARGAGCGDGAVGFLLGSCVFRVHSLSLSLSRFVNPTRGTPPAGAILFCAAVAPAVVLVRRGSWGGGGLWPRTLPFLLPGNEVMLRTRSGVEPLRCVVELRERLKVGASVPCTVASEVKLAVLLVAGEIGAARWAGFLATGGAAFCFVNCSCTGAGASPTDGADVILFTGFRF